MRRAARQALSSASGSPAGERARTTSAARAALAAATARLASVSGCGNWASTVRAPSAPAWTAVTRQWLEPVPPAVRNTTSGGAGGPAAGRSPAAGPRVRSDPREGAGRDRGRTGAARQRRMMHIRTDAALAEVVAALRREPLVAADTEAASFHRYRDRIFLVQL